MTTKYALYKEPLRPQFHFTARYWNEDRLNPKPHEEGWINDVNGLTYLDGEYHLFAQRWWSCWLHAISPDLVHWQELHPAFGKDEVFGGTQSGGAVVDDENTSGLATGKTPVMVAFWSSVDNRRQCISYSNDKGRTWTKYGKNPVLDHPCRDPRVFWYAPDRKWIMVLYGPEETGRRCYSLFASENLLTWEKLQSLPDFYECPDMFELPIDGNARLRKWVIVNGDGKYRMGRFDGKSFTPESGNTAVDLGRNFYATMTWGGLPGQPFRRIQVAWMAYWDRVCLDMPFNQQISFPCDLTLRTTPVGVRLFREPIREIERLYTETIRSAGQVVFTGDDNFLASITGELLDIDLVIDLEQSSCSDFCLSVRGHYVRCDLAGRRINILGCPAALEPQQKNLRLRILVDRLSIEAFLDGGRASFTNVALPVDAACPLRLRAGDGKLFVSELTVHKLKSIWEDP